VLSECLTKNDFTDCVKFDELYKFGMKDMLLSRMQEGSLLFPPTATFHLGKNEFDTQNEFPCWADRVLFSQTYPVMKLVHYGRVEDFKTSGHKPIIAAFQAKVWVVN